MKISLKKSNSHWIEIENVKLLIDYPTMDQQDELDELFSQAMSPALIKTEEIKRLNPGTSDEELEKALYPFIDFNSFKKYQRNFIRYTVKGWEGLDEECKIENNMLDKEQWELLVRDNEQLQVLYNKIKPELDWNNSDKKK